VHHPLHRASGLALPARVEKEVTEELQLDGQNIGRDEQGIVYAVARRFGLNPFQLLTHSAFFLVLAWSAGYWWAKHQDSFLVPVGAPDTVVLKIYGDKVITAPFSRSTRAVESKFKILKPDSGQLQWEKVGPLHLEK
jgi:hypothetical protein